MVKMPLRLYSVRIISPPTAYDFLQNMSLLDDRKRIKTELMHHYKSTVHIRLGANSADASIRLNS